MIESAIKFTKFDKLCFWFIVIDNLFLPYFWLKCISYSFPIIFLWYLQRRQVLRIYGYSRKQIIIILWLCGISTLLGVLLYPQYTTDDIAGFLGMVSTLLILQFFIFVRRITDEKQIRKVHMVLLYFVIFVCVFSIVYYYSPDLYFSLKYFFNARADDSYSVDAYTNTVRFGYYWSDENNIGYMTCAVAMFLFVSSYMSITKKFLILMMSVIICVATMSSGAIITLSIVFLFFLRYVLLGRDSKIKPFFKACIIVFFFAVAAYAITYLINSEIFQLMLIRLEGKESAGDGRTEIYKNIMEQINLWHYILFGTGSRTIIGGMYRSPHNILLHLMVAYGMIACILYMWIVYKKDHHQNIKYWLWRIPIFLGMFVNIMITEDKLNTLVMLLIAYELGTNKIKYIKKSDS